MTATTKVGDRAALRRTFTREDVEAFASMVGGQPSLQVEEAHVHGLVGRIVVPPALLSALFSVLVESRLPGPGSVTVGQMMKFLKPVYVGETVTASVEIVAVRESRRILRLAARATTARGHCVNGECVVRAAAVGAKGSA